MYIVERYSGEKIYSTISFCYIQELLQLFGLPYIIAPTEAEAQCAWLDAAGLVSPVNKLPLVLVFLQRKVFSSC